jgi:hypothetical protein
LTHSHPRSWSKQNRNHTHAQHPKKKKLIHISVHPHIYGTGYWLQSLEIYIYIYIEIHNIIIVYMSQCQLVKLILFLSERKESRCGSLREWFPCIDIEQVVCVVFFFFYTFFFFVCVVCCVVVSRALSFFVFFGLGQMDGWMEVVWRFGNLERETTGPESLINENVVFVRTGIVRWCWCMDIEDEKKKIESMFGFS